MDWDGITTDSNSVTNSGLISAIGSDAIRLGVNGTLFNTGTIEAIPDPAKGHDGLQLNHSGASITNSGVSSTGDGDGLDVDGVVYLTNNGIIQGLGAFGAGNNSEGIATGGGDIINRVGAEISGQMTTGTGGVGNGILIDDGNGGSGVALTTITNARLSQAPTGDLQKRRYTNWLKAT